MQLPAQGSTAASCRTAQPASVPRHHAAGSAAATTTWQVDLLAKQITHLLERQQLLTARNAELEAQARAADRDAARARDDAAQLQRALVQAQGTHHQLAQQLAQMMQLLLQEQQRATALNYEVTRWATSWWTSTTAATAQAPSVTGPHPTATAPAHDQ